LRHTEGFHPPFQTTECKLSAATFAGIVERLEMISVPLIAHPQGMMCDGSVVGFMYGGGDQKVSLSWYYPPEEWKPLARWHGETCRLFERAASARATSK
jgi:hypothetical protein